MDIFEKMGTFKKYLIKQTELSYPINIYGCNFRAIQAACEIKCKIGLKKISIEDLSYVACNMGHMTNDCYVNEPEEIGNSVLHILNSKYKIWNCGYINNNGVPVGWDKKPIDFDFCIIKLYQKDKSKRHFVLGNKSFELEWDAYPDSESAKLWDVKDIYLYKFYRR